MVEDMEFELEEVEEKTGRRNRGLKWNIVHFYIPKGKEHVYATFKEIVKREGKSVSQVLCAFMEAYVQRHASGNPQSRLDSFIEDEFPALPTLPHRYSVEDWGRFDPGTLRRVISSYSVALGRAREALHRLSGSPPNPCGGCEWFNPRTNWCRLARQYTSSLNTCPIKRW